MKKITNLKKSNLFYINGNGDFRYYVICQRANTCYTIQLYGM